MKKIIFISSLGRSGSMSIANAIDNVDGVKAFHVPSGLEDYNCNAYLKQLNRIKVDRKKLIEFVHDSNCHFVESMVCLRFYFEDVVKSYPECVIVHLVRDGRDYVRSGFNRPWFTTEKKDRFKMICKNWAEGQFQMVESMKKIPEHNRGGVVRFEDLIKGDISWFLDGLGLKSTKEITMPVVNSTKGVFKLPKWDEWNQKLINEAKIYMGKELEHFGYKW